MAPKHQKPVFRRRPEPKIEVVEGAKFILPCELETPLPSAGWLRDRGDGIRVPLFGLNFTRDTYLTPNRFKFVGNLELGDYSIELDGADLTDSGAYFCQTASAGIFEADNLKDYTVATNITVQPKPPPDSQPSIIMASSLHSSSAQSQNQADADSGSNGLLSSNNLDQLDLIKVNKNKYPGSSARAAQSQLQAREAGWTKLSSASYISPSLQPSAFVNSHPLISSPSSSTAYSIRGGSSGFQTNSLMLSWPFLLLALAGLLMLANIYLIYSLIKRHTSCSTKGEPSRPGSSSADIESSEGQDQVDGSQIHIKEEQLCANHTNELNHDNIHHNFDHEHQHHIHILPEEFTQHQFNLNHVHLHEPITFVGGPHLTHYLSNQAAPH